MRLNRCLRRRLLIPHSEGFSSFPVICGGTVKTLGRLPWTGRFRFTYSIPAAPEFEPRLALWFSVETIATLGCVPLRRIERTLWWSFRILRLAEYGTAVQNSDSVQRQAPLSSVPCDRGSAVKSLCERCLLSSGVAICRVTMKGVRRTIQACAPLVHYPQKNDH